MRPLAGDRIVLDGAGGLCAPVSVVGDLAGPEAVLFLLSSTSFASPDALRDISRVAESRRRTEARAGVESENRAGARPRASAGRSAESMSGHTNCDGAGLRGGSPDARRASRDPRRGRAGCRRAAAPPSPPPPARASGRPVAPPARRAATVPPQRSGCGPPSGDAVEDFLAAASELRLPATGTGATRTSGDGDVRHLYGVYHPYFVRGDVNDDGHPRFRHGVRAARLVGRRRPGSRSSFSRAERGRRVRVASGRRRSSSATSRWPRATSRSTATRS